jgi:uncharacterized repeat protein (TIGR02543 family)
MLSRFLKILSRTNVARLTVAAILLGSLQVVTIVLPNVSNAADPGSVEFGAGAYISAEQDQNLKVSDNWTIEGYFKTGIGTTGTARYLLRGYSSTNVELIQIYLGPAGYLTAYGFGAIKTDGTVLQQLVQFTNTLSASDNSNVWNHFIFQNSSSTACGVVQASSSSLNGPYSWASSFSGKWNTASNCYKPAIYTSQLTSAEKITKWVIGSQGNIANLRVSNTARYDTSINLARPTGLLTADANTLFLLGSDNSAANFQDSTGKLVFSKFGSVTNSSINPFLAPVANPTHTVAYNLGGGSGTLPTQAAVSEGASFSTGSSSGITRDGYTFNKWSDGIADYAAGASYTMSTSNVALTATWSPNTNNITWNDQIPTTASSGGSSSYTTATAIAAIPTTAPQKSGYTFIGWNTLADGTGDTVTAGSYTPISPFGAKTIYAKWSADPHHVTYNLNGGDSTLPTQVDVVTAGTFTTAATPTKSNYTFSGWSNGATSTAASTSYTMGTSDLTLTAQWTPAFQITFISTGSAVSPLTYSSTALGKPTDPTRTGYSFSKWQDSSGTEITWPFTPTGPIELTAVWSANSYVVTYVYNGATSDTSTVTSAFTTGDATPISLPSPQKTGYNFGGWYGEIGLTNQIGLAGASYSPTGATTAISLFAKWIINSYSVTYTAGANGSITGTSSQTINHGSNATLVTATPAANHHFVSWSDNVLTAGRTDLNVVSNLSVSATFAIDTVTVTYNPNGGVVDTATVTTNFGGTVNHSTATWVGYHFDGWYDSQVGGNLVSTGFQASANRQLWARWTQLSLYGIPSGDLGTPDQAESHSTLTKTITSSLDANTGSQVRIPAGAFSSATLVKVYTLPNNDLARAKVSANDSYIISQVVAWQQKDDNSVKTAAIAIEMIITSPLIKRGAVVYSILGDQVTELARATVDGSVTVLLTTDPAVVVAVTKPGTPTAVSATSGGNMTSVVTWSAPLEDGGSAITGYSVTSSPSVTPPAGCTNVNATSCTFTGLTNGTSYIFRVVAINAIGTSETSTASAPITPLDPIQAPAFTMSSSTETVVLGGALVGYTITSTGGAVASYAISPSIGNGLSFSTSTGLISGTPSNAATAVVYTVSAHNASAPDASQTFTLTVTAPTPAPAPAPTPAPTPAPSGGGGGGGSVYVAPTPDPAIAIAEAAKAKAAAEKIAADAKAVADLKAAQDKAAAEAAQAAALKAAQELADAQAKADAELKAAQDKALEDARIAEELRLAQEKAEADLRAVAEKKAAEDAAAAALLAARKIVPNVTLYSISNSLKLSTYYTSYLKKYVSKLKPTAKVTCVGYMYTKNTTYAKAKLLASKQAKAVCALIKKQKKTIITSTLLYPSSKAPKAAAGAKWVAVSYRVDGYKS